MQALHCVIHLNYVLEMARRMRSEEYQRLQVSAVRDVQLVIRSAASIERLHYVQNLQEVKEPDGHEQLAS